MKDAARPTTPSGAVAPEPHAREEQRLSVLHALNLLDSAPDPRFDRITNLAADVFDVPIALISLVDENRQWFLSRCGLEETETGRDESFCGHALHETDILVVEDATEDDRFATNPLVTGGPNIRFYAGAVLEADDGLPLGTLCLIDTKPRSLSVAERRRLVKMARLTRAELLPNSNAMYQRSEAQLAAQVDPLTNARWTQPFLEAVDEALEKDGANGTAGSNEHGVAVMIMINVPKLEQINNVFGRMTGDEILLEVCRRLQTACSAFGTPVTGRLGGHRLAAFLIGPGTSDTLGDLKQRLRSVYEAPYKTKGNVRSVNLQVGLCEIDGTLATGAEAIDRCRLVMNDMDMREELAVEVCSADKLEPHNRRANLASGLRVALENDELELHFQPKVGVESRALAGFESLLRWTHPDFGYIPPPDVVDAAEEVNLSNELDRWVVRTAIAQISAWQDSGQFHGPVSVNINGLSLFSDDFSGWLSDTLAEFDVAAKWIDLEIVESSIFNDFDATIAAMTAVTELGATFSLDDFGTGYSSLAYLQELPVQSLKIDRSFVNSIVEDQKQAALCHSVVTIGRDMGMQTIAEGVETEHQYLILRAYRCPMIQGYYFAKPLPPGDATAMLSDVPAAFH